tara:strand:+ start:126 stop:356 length:231 start_codon:yes stop_codon:yes gene_type:complete
MSWENILKEGFEDIDSFIKEMKKISIVAINEYEKFNDKTSGEFTSIEMKDLATTIIDMADAIKSLEKMRNKQEELQ